MSRNDEIVGPPMRDPTARKSKKAREPKLQTRFRTETPGAFALFPSNPTPGLGARLRTARNRAGLKQREAANALGISQQSISQLECERFVTDGGQGGNSRYFIPLCRLYGISPWWLHTGQGNMEAMPVDIEIVLSAIAADPERSAYLDTVRLLLEKLRSAPVGHGAVLRPLIDLLDTLPRHTEPSQGTAGTE